MKFGTHAYWKHRGDCCDFFRVLEVIEDNGETAFLKVSWCTQLHRNWKTLVRLDQFRISKKDYPKYQIFSPRGEEVPWM